MSPDRDTECLRLRQLVLVAHSLEPIGTLLREILGLGAAYSDPGVGDFGLENLVFPVGDQFLEVVAPREPETAAGRYLERFGPGGYMVIIQVPDLEHARRRADSLGLRSVWTGKRAEGEDRIEGVHFHPKDCGGTILSIDEVHPPSGWPWGGGAWRDEIRTDRVQGLSHGILRHDQPDVQAARWAELLGVADGSATLALGAGESLRFGSPEEGRTTGLDEIGLRTDVPAVVLAAAERAGCVTGSDWFDLGGARFRVG